jgi:hypothetical protein
MTSLNDLYEFCRDRANVERQLGHNQVSAGNEAGHLRLNRADLHDECAEQIARLMDLEK